jgi:TP901 family phage tail tape measure protein
MAINKTIHLLSVLFETRGDRATASKIRKVGTELQTFQKRENKLAKEATRNKQRTIREQKKVVEGNKRASASMQDLTKAMRRALIVAPVWLAIRSIMLGVLTTVKEGTKAWIDFDRAIQRATLVIHGQIGTVANAVERLKEEVTTLSIETGQKLDNLTAAFYRFGTVGNVFENSLNGMRVAANLAITTFGETEEIAKFLALTYKLLGDTVDESVPEHQRLEVVSAQILKLFKDNAFQIGEMTQAFKQFLPTAKVFNFSIEESLVLLASLQTAGLQAGIAGRNLRTAIQKMIPNLDVISRELNVEVNPALDSTFDILIKTIGAINQLGAEGAATLPELSRIFGEIFGGVRSRQAAQALSGAYDIVIKNINNASTAQGKWNQLIKDQQKDIDDVTSSFSFQQKRLENLRVLAGQAFVKGIFGGTEKAAENIVIFNDSLEQSLDIIQQVHYLN